MTELHPNWNSLPFEILYNVFEQMPAKQLCVLSHVCKAWLHPVRTCLYSEIYLESLLQLEKFYNTVEENTSLGDMVKTFEVDNFILHLNMDARNMARRKAFNIITTLLSKYLLNLEVLQDTTTGSYIPVLDALLDSQLRHLKILQTPTLRSEKSEVLNYVTCVFLMRDRLENLLISDDYDFGNGPSGEQLFFNRLQSKLNQFDKVTKIRIRRETNEGIEVLDNIVESSESFKNITFNFKLRDKNMPPNNNISINTISKFVSRPHIKVLVSTLNEFIDEKFLIYIMHKFSQLEKLSLGAMEHKVYKLSSHTITQFLKYLSQINDFNVHGLSLESDSVTETIGNFWNATSTPGSKQVEFCYSEALCGESLSLTNKSTDIGYSSEDPEWKHVGFIEKNGKFINVITLSFLMHNSYTSERCVLPEDFMTHTLTCCPSLQYLNIEHCTLRSLSVIMNKKFALEELSFVGCKICGCTLENLSLNLSEIKHLRFYDNSYIPGEQEYKGAIEVYMMPYTKVDKITFGVFPGDSRFIKLFVQETKKYYYFQLNTNDKQANISSKEQYEGAKFYECISICCQTKPSFNVEELR